MECPCGQSSDAFSIRDDASFVCYSCDNENISKEFITKFLKYKETGNIVPETYEHEDIEHAVDAQEVDEITKGFTKSEIELWKLGVSKAIADRRISKETVKKYSVRITNQPAGLSHMYPYCSSVGKVIGFKVRDYPKVFHAAGNTKDCMLFGMNIFPSGGRFITITEGELDAMSAYQMLGGKGPVISLINGSNSIKKALKTKQIYEYLNSFGNVVVCFDNDRAGRKAAEYITNVFEFGKVIVMKLSTEFKDASDYLMAGKSRDFVEAFWRAEKQTPNDIKILSSKEFKKSVLSRDKSICYSYPYDALNRTTYGLRLGELVTLIAETGVGKTQVMRELELHFLDTTEFSIGLLHLEEKAEKSIRGLMSVRLNKRIDLPDTDSTYEEEEKAYDSLNDRLTVFDSFGSNDIDIIMDRVRFMVKAVGCKIIFLDHISMIVSDQRFNDERRALDEICTKLKQATVDWNFNLHMVAHVNRQGLIRGTGNIEKLSDIVLRIERDITNEDEVKRNTTSILCEKNRYSGDTGPSGWLYYDRETGRLIETGNPDMFEEDEDE